MRALAAVLVLFLAGCGTTGTLNVSWGGAQTKVDEVPTIYLTPDQVQRMFEAPGKIPL